MDLDEHNKFTVATPIKVIDGVAVCMQHSNGQTSDCLA